MRYASRPVNTRFMARGTWFLRQSQEAIGFVRRTRLGLFGAWEMGSFGTLRDTIGTDSGRLAKDPGTAEAVIPHHHRGQPAFTITRSGTGGPPLSAISLSRATSPSVRRCGREASGSNENA